MPFPKTPLFCACAIAVAWGSVAWNEVLAQAPQALKLRGIRYPNRVDGVLRSVIEGDSAVVLSNEDMNVSGLSMEIYGASGGVTRVKAADCIYRPEAGTADSESRVRMEYGTTTMNGNGFTWRKADDRVFIKRDVDVCVSNAAEWSAGPDLGPAGAGTGTVSIVSSRMEFRPAAETGVFEKDVKVVRPGMTITSDELTVSLGQGKVLSMATASGNVAIVQADSTGTCSRAVLDSEAGTITLAGDARLVRGGEEVRGDRITLLRGRDRILAESGYLRFCRIRRIGGEKGAVP